MYSKVDIYNMALGFMGSGTYLADAQEKRIEAVQLNLFYDLARRTVLRDFPYSFAQRRANVAQTTKPTEFGDFEYAYKLPYNCLKVQNVSDGNSFGVETSQEDIFPSLFRIVASLNEGNILLCNISPCILEYTEDVDDLANSDESFVEMLSYKLAALVCIPLLKGNTAKLQELNQLYAAKLSQAMQNDATSKKLAKKQDSWVAIAKNY